MTIIKLLLALVGGTGGLPVSMGLLGLLWRLVAGGAATMGLNLVILYAS